MPIQFPGNHRVSTRSPGIVGVPSQTEPAPKPASNSLPQDTVTLSGGSEPSEPSRSFFENLKQKFSSASQSLRPLELSEAEKGDGQKAASTMDRLAGADGKWDANDLANNIAQIDFPRGLKGVVAKGMVVDKFMDGHAVPDSQRQEILSNANKIRQDNPDIAKLRKLESYDPTKFKDPGTLEKYSTMKRDLTESLNQKGLMPISLEQVQDFGRSADLLKAKLNEAGLPQPKPGKPMDPGQFRQLFEGKSPLSTQF